MSTQPESRLQRRIRQHLSKVYLGSWWVKFHGGPFTPAGVPDLIGCVEGRMVALEVKQPGEHASRIQQATHVRLARSGAIVGVVTSCDDATRCVREGLLRTPKLETR